jgi:regulation of enolase protein 1 (concanavalin A-like superfamily)
MGQTFVVASGSSGTFTIATNTTPVGGSLPGGWSNNDIGAVAAAGSASVDGTTYTVRGSGADIWGTADEFHYAWRAVSGDFTAMARVVSVENVDQWAKAGLMVRETGGSAGARHASLFATPTTAKGLAFQRRPTTGGTSVSTAGPALTAPVWLRLVRAGNVVTASYRRNATDAWTPVGSQTFTSLPVDAQVGFAVSSHRDGTVATATFDNVSIFSGSATDASVQVSD